MLAFVCIICAVVTSVLYTFAGQPDGLPSFAEVIAAYLLPASIALWVRGDAHRRRRPLPYDLDSFVFLFWPIAAPVYLLRTRGLSGCGPIILGILLMAAVVWLEGLLLLHRFSADGP